MSVISRPPLISFKEFKERLADHDGYGKTRRIIMFGFNQKDYRYKYMIPMVGPKQLCYKEAYCLLFLEQDEDERELWIMEGAFKIPANWNFTQELHVQNSKIIKNK